MKDKKIIWFKRNPSPDDKAIAKAQGLIIRDPAVCHGHDFVEHCDAVCGDVPVSYGHCEVVELTGSEGELVDAQGLTPVNRGRKAKAE